MRPFLLYSLSAVLPSALSVCVLPEEGFHIDLDDFIMGIISVANELVSLQLASERDSDMARI